MMYLVSQIAVSLAVATVLGAAIGWWLRSIRAGAPADEPAIPLRQAQSELTTPAAQPTPVDPRIQLLETRLAELKKRNEVLEATMQSVDADAERDRAQLEATAKQLEELQARHADCDFAFAALRDQIISLRAKVAALKADEPAIPEQRKAS